MEKVVSTAAFNKLPDACPANSIHTVLACVCSDMTGCLCLQEIEQIKEDMKESHAGMI